MNNSVDWIFPICGEGSRTQERGAFKPLILIKGRHLFNHFIEKLLFHIKTDDRIILIMRKDHNSLYNVKNIIEKIINSYLPGIQIISIIVDKPTSGPVDTISNAISYIKEDSIISIVNPDQVIDFKWPSKISNNAIYLPIGFDCQGKSSYVIISEEGLIKNIFEKEQVSFYASVGVYIFGSKDLLNIGFKELSKRKGYEKNKEQYISHLVKSLLEIEVLCYPLETTVKYDLGNMKCIDYYEGTQGQRRNNLTK